MTTCPSCNAKCNPMKFLLMVSKWSPYVCLRCKTKSDFPLKQNIILGLVIGLLFGILSYLLSKVIGGFSIIVTVILIFILIPLIQYYFMDLEKVDD
jgi:ribose/xylose/arabinose/galactoside ABC-type transport system permease subunit